MVKPSPVFGFVIGPSGVGKDFGVGRIFVDFFGAEIFVSGDWCRDHAREFANRGVLIEDKDIVSAAEEHYLKKDRPLRFIFDCPRTVNQAQMMIRKFNDWRPGAKIVTTHIHAKPQTCIDRIKHRAEQRGRDDDACDEVISRRIGTYFNRGGIRDSVVPYLQEHTNYHLVDGDEDLEQFVRPHVRSVIAPALFGC